MVNLRVCFLFAIFFALTAGLGAWRAESGAGEYDQQAAHTQTGLAGTRGVVDAAAPPVCYRSRWPELAESLHAAEARQALAGARGQRELRRRGGSHCAVCEDRATTFA